MEIDAIALALANHFGQRICAFDVVVLESVNHLITIIELGQDIEGVVAVPAEDEAKILVHVDDRTKVLDCFDDAVGLCLHVSLSF